jgi:hypothetical protein
MTDPEQDIDIHEQTKTDKPDLDFTNPEPTVSFDVYEMKRETEPFIRHTPRYSPYVKKSHYKRGTYRHHSPSDIYINAIK